MRRRRNPQRQSQRKQNRRLLLESLETRKLLTTFELSNIGSVDLPGVIFDGVAGGDQSGFDVSGVGDVNNDGTNDLLIGAPGTGDSYVVFGRDPAAGGGLGAFPTDLSTLAGGGGTQGFQITGSSNAGFSVSGTGGDVNGDGIDDLILGAPDDGATGSAYVVFGKASFGGTVNLSSLGSGGFKLTGGTSFGSYNYDLGFSVASGDLDGDGFADVIVGDPAAQIYSFNYGGYTRGGKAHVVFGRDTVAAGGSEANFPSSLNVSSLSASEGFVLSSYDRYGLLGYSVGNAGDVDGDGFDDVIVGSPGYGGYSNYGNRAFVVFSKVGGGFGSGLTSADFFGGGPHGFRISGANEHAGRSVAGAGDVNGDGTADLLVGEYSNSGQSQQYIIFGTSATGVQLAADGVKLEGVGTFNHGSVEFAASAAGDFNGDSIDDLIVGARDADPGGRSNAGQGFIVFGSTGLTGGSTIDLDVLGTGGHTFNGIDAGDNAGHSVTNLGDVNGDGVSDILIGAANADPNGGSSGESYLVFGQSAKIPITLTANVNAGTEAGGTEVTLTATADEAVAGAQTIDVDVSGTNILPTDFTLSGMTFNFADGAINATNQLTFTIADDSFFEGLETATIALTNPSNGVTPGTTDSQDVDITDDEVQPTVNLSVTANAGTEAGTTAITVTATSSATGEVDQTVDLTPTGTATVVADFTLSGTSFTIPAGSTTDNVTFTVVNDSIVESNTDETATLTLSNPSFNVAIGGTPSQDIDIDSEDTATVSIVGEEKNEGTGANTTFTFTVSLSAEVDAVVSATANTADGTAEQPGDYTQVSGGTVTFPANNNTDQTVDVTVIADSDFESDEAFDLILSSLVNNDRPVTFAGAGVTETASATIKNDDLPSVELSVSANAGTEAGTTAITVTATANGAVSGDQTVNLGVTPGAGITVSDYFISNTQITILDTQTSGNVTFTVADDDVVEALTETATLTISNPSSGIVLGSNLSEDIAITDDDAATVSIVGESKVEGTGANTTFTFTVSLSKEVDINVSATANTANGTAEQPGDYTQLAGGTVTFPANDNTNQTVDVTVIADSDFEANETFDLVLSSLSAPSRAVAFAGAGATETGTATIQNDDASPNPTVDISLSANAGTEAGMTEITVTATASSAVGANETVDVSVTGTGITGTDYTLSDAGTITILNGQTTGQLTFTVSDDSDIEGDETATLSLTNPSSGIDLGTTISDDVVITDDDTLTPPTGVFLNELLIDPDGAPDAPNEYVEIRGTASTSLEGVFLIFLEGDSDASPGLGAINAAGDLIDLTATSIGSNGFLAVVDGTGASAHPYTIAAGTTIVDIDGLDFENASWTALLIHNNGISADPVNSQDLDTDDNGLDTLPTGWTILDSIGVLDGAPTDRAYSSLAFSSNADGLSAGTIVNTGFGVDEVQHVMRIGDTTGSTTGDWVAFEHDGTAPDFIVIGTTAGAYELGTDITDHLGASNPTSTTFAPRDVNLSVDLSSGTEAAMTVVTVTATADGTVLGNQTVDIAASGTGITGTDYVLSDTSITILAGETSGDVTFTIQDDGDVEGTETATLTISNPSAGVAIGTTGTQDVDIIDDDLDTAVTLVSNTLTVTDTSGGDSDDKLSISFAGGTYTITDTGGLLIDASSISGSTGSGTDTVTIPDTDVNSILLDTLGGDDSLTLDFSNNFTVPIRYDGGETDETGGDELTLTGGGTFALATYNFNNVAGGDADNGTIDITGNQTITYTGLEPITSNITSTDVTLVYSSAVDVISVTDSGFAGRTTVDSDFAETVTFNNPGGTLTLNGGDGSDNITLTSMGSGFVGNLTIDGQGDADTINLNGGITFAVDKNLSVIGDTINVAASQTFVTTGTGTVGLTAERNVQLNSGSSLTTVNGGITVDANQQLTPTTGNFTGINVIGATVQSTGAGSVAVRGRSGDTGSRGIYIASGGEIIGGTSGTVTVEGTTIGTGSNRNAIYIRDSGSSITASGANVQLTGQAGGSNVNNVGVLIINGAEVSATGAGTLAINGTGGTGAGTVNQGVRIRDNGFVTIVSTADGNLTITGAEGSGTSNSGFHYTGGGGGRIETTGAGSISIVTDTVEMTGTGTIRTTGTGSLAIRPRTATTSIGVGGGSGTLGLDDTALAYLADGFSSITIGDVSSGTGDIDIDTATFQDPVTLAGGTTSDSTGTDVAAPSVSFDANVAPGASPGILNINGNASLANDSDFTVEIGGTTAGEGAGNHDQLSATGSVTIGTGVTLNLSAFDNGTGSDFAPVGGETIEIISRTGGTGNFDSLPPGATISNDFLSSGLTATIGYDGGDGDDVEINVLAPLPTVELSVSANAGTEDDTTVITVTGTASSAVSGNQTVDLAVTGTNITGGDYTLTATQITIDDGQTSGDVTFTVTDDNLVELLETATLTISNPSAGVSLGSNLTEDIAITNNDSATVSVSGQNKDEGTGGSTTFTFTVSLSKLVDTNVTMVADTQNGSAVAPGDYTAVSGANVTFPASTLPDQTVDVTVTADSDIESNETLDLVLSSLSAGGRPVTFIGTGATETATSLLVNDDFGAGGSGTVIENGDTGAGFGTVGGWVQVNNKPQLAERDFLYSLAGSGENSAMWSFDGIASGQYRISISYRAWNNRATNAPFTIRDTGTFLTTIAVDQTKGANATPTQPAQTPDLIEDVNGNQVHFLDLATINIVGSRIDVSLDNNANGLVVADAVRIERLGDVIAGPEVHVADGSTVITDGSTTIDFGSVEQDEVVSKTFTVTNFGTQDLTLVEPISVPSGFAVTQSFGITTLTSLQSTTFEVTVDTTNLGLQTGQISFDNNDSDENPFNFTAKVDVLVDSGIEIIDDDDPGYSQIGSWTPVGRNGHKNDFEYAFSGNGANVSTWNFDVTAGQFEVFAAWRAFSNRALNAPFTIFNDAFAITTVQVDQTVAPAADVIDEGTTFQSLGVFNISSDTLRVTLSDLGSANRLVIADAIRIARLGDIPPGSEILVQDENGAEIADNTGVIDFGDVELGDTVIKQITIWNFGSENLTLDPIGAMTGFTTTNFVSNPITPNTMTTFDLQIDTSSLGALSDTLSFGNNDGDENPFNFTVQGNVTPVSLAQTIDNGDSGFTTSGLAWNRVYTNGHDSDFDYANLGAGDRVATYTFNLAESGTYRVSTHWRQLSNRTETALYEVFDGDATSGISRGTASVNQRNAPLADRVEGGSNFQDLGTFVITGNQLTVTLTNQTDGLTIADAILIDKV